MPPASLIVNVIDPGWTCLLNVTEAVAVAATLPAPGGGVSLVTTGGVVFWVVALNTPRKKLERRRLGAQ